MNHRQRVLAERTIRNNQTERIAALEAENERLRAAIEEIWKNAHGTDGYEIAQIARRALEK